MAKSRVLDGLYYMPRPVLEPWAQPHLRLPTTSKIATRRQNEQAGLRLRSLCVSMSKWSLVMPFKGED